MKFLIDQNRSPKLASLLNQAGHDAVHADEIGLGTADDDVLLERARAEDRVVVTGDTDFGALLALAHLTKPSVILFRQRSGWKRAGDQATLILDHLNDVVDDLAAGCIVVFTENRLRIRKLPLFPSQ